MKEAPCKDCPKKGCGAYHDKCPEYKEFKEYQLKSKEEYKKKLMVEVEMNSYITEKALKAKKLRTRLKQR